MNIPKISEIKVGLRFTENVISVGNLKLENDVVSFVFDNQFLEKGIEVSPINCPVKPSVLHFKERFLMGVPGFIYDCLPDYWGEDLVHGKFSSLDVSEDDITVLDRLYCVGNQGMGALVYEPNMNIEVPEEKINLDKLAKESLSLIRWGPPCESELLFSLSGSAGGARPKAIINLHVDKTKVMHGLQDLTEDYEPWLVKFPHSRDSADEGAIEYVYALMAKEAGLDFPEVHLIPAERAAGYFSVKRFDRIQNNRIHMQTAAGLLHANFRRTFLDYKDLMELTMKLTNDIREVEKMFQLAVFNVCGHNRDDHLKNFSFLMDDKGVWQLTPAYDITFCKGIGWQCSSVLGEKENPSEKDLIKLGVKFNIPKKTILEIIEKTKSALSQWKKLAKEYDVQKENVEKIDKLLIN